MLNLQAVCQNCVCCPNDNTFLHTLIQHDVLRYNLQLIAFYFNYIRDLRTELVRGSLFCLVFGG